jgi:hypothetical protein
MARRRRSTAFRRAVLEAWELSPSERVLLDEICATLDALDRGDLTPAQARQERLALCRLLGALGLDEPTAGPGVADGKSIRGRRAAEARWRRARGMKVVSLGGEAQGGIG